MSAPLDGVLVVDLTRALAGPHAGMMLGDLGARVIKVESPDGDESRAWGPPFVAGSDGREHATYFLSCNRNKESIACDLKSDDGRAVLTALVERADVLIENFRPGVLDRLGFSVERLHELNPGLVILSITGFGHDGPEGDRPGYDQIAQGEGGLMSVTGPSPDEPTRAGLPVGDILAGMYGAYGVAAALVERARTGRGQVVRTSLLAAVVGAHAFHGHSLHGGGGSAAHYRQLPPVDLPLRAVPGGRRIRADRGRQRHAVEPVRPGVRARPAGVGAEPRAGRRPRGGQRRRERRLQRAAGCRGARRCSLAWGFPLVRFAIWKRCTPGTRPGRRGC